MNLLLHEDQSIVAGFIDALGYAAAIIEVQEDGFGVLAVNGEGRRYFSAADIPPGTPVNVDTLLPLVTESRPIVEGYVNHMLENFERVVETGEAIVTETPYGPLWSRNRITPIVDNGRIVRLLILFTDVTELYAKRDALVEALWSTLPDEIEKCSQCHKIRQEDGYWMPISNFIARHSDLTHTICPDCAEKFETHAAH